MAAIEFINTTLYTDPALVAYYRLENTTATVGGNNLTNNGTVAFNAAKFNNGADTGTSINKYLSSNTPFNLGQGTMTLSLWFKSNTATPSAAGTIVDNFNNTSKTKFSIDYSTISSTKRVYFSRTIQAVGTAQVQYNIDLGTSVYHHLVMTLDGTDLKGYIDGVLVGSVSATNGTGTGTITDKFIIGAPINLEASFGMSGIADDVVLFSRALTASEIYYLYTNTNPNSGSALLEFF